MTINVAIKCPDGIVMGSDSLITIESDAIVTSIIPYYSKLFPLGNLSKSNNYMAGAMMNGDSSIGGRNIEDIIYEFVEVCESLYPTNNYLLKELTIKLGKKIQSMINKNLNGQNPVLEIIIGGYSLGKKSKGKRYGEIYSLFWNHEPFRIRENYITDTEFGTIYGGHPKAVDRFLYGIDDWILNYVLDKREFLFEQIKEYIRKKLKKKGVIIPENIIIDLPDLEQFDVFSLFSNYELGDTIGETMKNVKRGTFGRLNIMERFFNLQTAVNYCIFLMSCAYAENNYTYQIPGVGSEMRIATITRNEGFKFRKLWDIKTPAPPFS